MFTSAGRERLTNDPWVLSKHNDYGQAKMMTAIRAVVDVDGHVRNRKPGDR